MPGIYFMAWVVKLVCDRQCSMVIGLLCGLSLCYPSLMFKSNSFKCYASCFCVFTTLLFLRACMYRHDQRLLSVNVICHLCFWFIFVKLFISFLLVCTCYCHEKKIQLSLQYSSIPLSFSHACILGFFFSSMLFCLALFNVKDLCSMFQGRLEAGADYQLHSVWPSVPFLGTEPGGSTQQRSCRGASEQ